MANLLGFTDYSKSWCDLQGCSQAKKKGLMDGHSLGRVCNYFLSALQGGWHYRYRGATTSMKSVENFVLSVFCMARAKL